METSARTHARTHTHTHTHTHTQQLMLLRVEVPSLVPRPLQVANTGVRRHRYEAIQSPLPPFQVIKELPPHTVSQTPVVPATPNPIRVSEIRPCNERPMNSTTTSTNQKLSSGDRSWPT